MSDCPGCGREAGTKNEYCSSNCYKKANGFPETMPITECLRRNGEQKDED